jgi:hypothetical protein
LSSDLVPSKTIRHIAANHLPPDCRYSELGALTAGEPLITQWAIQ